MPPHLLVEVRTISLGRSPVQLFLPWSFQRTKFITIGDLTFQRVRQYLSAVNFLVKICDDSLDECFAYFINFNILKHFDVHHSIIAHGTTFTLKHCSSNGDFVTKLVRTQQLPSPRFRTQRKLIELGNGQ